MHMLVSDFSCSPRPDLSPDESRLELMHGTGREEMASKEEATIVRVRCRRGREGSGRCVLISEVAGDVTYLPGAAAQASFQFDKVYGEQCSQEAIFNDVCFVVSQALDGYNGTIMAYGQTGSGKTHTLIGNLQDPQQLGIVPRAVAFLASRITTADKGEGFQVRMSVVEIYCERVRDLLYPEQDNLAIKQDLTRGVYVEGATEISVASEAQIMVLMQQGLSKRAVAATNMNAESSRSHCIVTMIVEKTNCEGLVQSGKLVMVDLAGSERSDKTGTTGSQLQEGSQINKSLSCLANVIFALTDEKVKHIPYRSRGMTSHTVVNTKVSIPRLQQQLEALKIANAELTMQLQLRNADTATPQPRLQSDLSYAPNATSQQNRASSAGLSEQPEQQCIDSNSDCATLVQNHLQVCNADPSESNHQPLLADLTRQLEPDVIDVSFSSQLQSDADEGVHDSNLKAKRGKGIISMGFSVCGAVWGIGGSHASGDTYAQSADACTDMALSVASKAAHGLNKVCDRKLSDQGKQTRNVMQRRGLMWLDAVYYALMLSSVVMYFVWEDSMRARGLL